ncbi:type II toxin-antitoxin system RelE/ParE family toxin [Caulobacter segnis]|uniref:type II toxin-antitoxin system RelE/ParE family toxin n=1 Tax=Caulobacter segnis TaxID=88688 RepID=UPI0024103B84|nr:type II toxin-antitoxin system RelE/ParE family toxin [Caulobacter segnis]MDG2520324.1 type II toxin-antitoxin system RelE/ParE family toxin [Caulobacter segnis]
MIRNWKSHAAKEVFEGRAPKGFPSDLVKKTRRLLAQLNAVTAVEQLRHPPGNRLHALSGDLAGKWSLSVNDQFRIVFVWGPEGPQDVWFGDYH